MTAAGKAYFRYHFRSKWKLLLCIVAITLVLTVIASSGQRREWSSIDFDTHIAVNHVDYSYTSGVFNSVILICGCMLPITEFSFFKKRRNLDCVYGLPITRREMGIIHYITGLLCMIIPFTCSYLVNFLFMLRYPEDFYYPPVLGYYFLSLLIGICAYSVNVFVFNQANSVGDGMVFMLAWTLCFSSIAGTWNSVLHNIAVKRGVFNLASYSGTYVINSNNFFDIMLYETRLMYTDMGIPWGALSEIEMAYSDVIEKGDNASLSWLWKEPECVVWIVLWGVLGVASVFGFIFSFGKRRAEKTEEVSDSWFGYRLMIPLYALMGIISSGSYGMLMYVILAFAGYVIYRRGLRLKKCDWISLSFILLFGIIISLIFKGTLLGAY